MPSNPKTVLWTKHPSALRTFKKCKGRRGNVELAARKKQK
jgi:hypothetical protein